jgi:hypothetical protein
MKKKQREGKNHQDEFLIQIKTEGGERNDNHKLKDRERITKKKTKCW